ncbi:MAG: hypothetical protein ABIR94_09960 [Rubrivivax sp.]
MQPHIGFDAPLRLVHRAQALHERLHILGKQEVAQRPAGQPPRRQADKAAESAIGKVEHAAPVADPDQGRRAVGQHPKALLALAQARLGQRARADVALDCRQCLGLAVVALDHRHAQRDGQRRAITVLPARLDHARPRAGFQAGDFLLVDGASGLGQQRQQIVLQHTSCSG